MVDQIKKDRHDPVKLRNQAERARRADAIVNDPIFIEALDSIEREIETGWKTSAAEDTKARDNAYDLYRLLKRLRREFRQILISGTNAKVLLAAEDDGGRRSDDSAA
jgi:hypothetical protein